MPTKWKLHGLHLRSSEAVFIFSEFQDIQVSNKVIIKLVVLTERNAVFTHSFVLLTRRRRGLNLCRKDRMDKTYKLCFLPLFQRGKWRGYDGNVLKTMPPSHTDFYSTIHISLKMAKSSFRHMIIKNLYLLVWQFLSQSICSLFKFSFLNFMHW